MFKIIDQIPRLKQMITDFSTTYSLPILNPMLSPVSGIIPDADNQILYTSLKTSDVYLIGHNDLNIFEMFLNVSQKTIDKINHIRCFATSFYGYNYIGDHKRLKIQIKHEDSVEFKIIGNNYSPITIKITETMLNISLERNNTSSAMLSDYLTLDDAFDKALDTLIPSILKKEGFDKHNENSPEVVDFVAKSLFELINPHFKKTNLNYIELNDLISISCNDLNIDRNEILNNTTHYHSSNFDRNASKLIKLPSLAYSILPAIMNNIFTNVAHNSGLRQLFNLIHFYYSLKNEDIQSSFGVKHIAKYELINTKKFNTKDAFYHLEFKGLLNINIGHEMSISNKIDDIYKYTPIEHADGYTFNFSISLGVKDNEKPIKYFTNNVNSIYVKLLNLIRNEINQKIDNSSDVITSHDIDLYRMITI